MKKFLLILLVFLLIPSLSLAKEYRNDTFNFQLDVPEKWLVEENKGYAALISNKEVPHLMIAVKVKQDPKLKAMFVNNVDIL